MQSYAARLGLTLSAIASFWLLAAGSAGPSYIDTTDTTQKPIPYGRVVSDIRIVADDGSFELKSGEQFSSPFQSSIWGSSCPLFSKSKLLESYNNALNCGAQRVKVYVGDNPTPLHGVLALNQSIAAAYGPASKSYYIKLSQDKIDAALAGNNSVSYEKINWKETWVSDGYAKSDDQWWYGWMLWLSSYPM